MKHYVKKLAVIVSIFSLVLFYLTEVFAGPLVSQITTEQKVLLYNQIKEFNKYLIEGNYKKAKMFIEPRYRENWFEERLNETEPITFLEISIKKMIPYQQVIRASNNIKISLSNYYGEETISIKSNNNWFYKNGHWYLSNMALLPLVAVTAKTPIFVDKDKEIKCRELAVLIDRCQDKIGRYLERLTYYNPKAKSQFDEAEIYFYLSNLAAFEKRTTSQEREESDKRIYYYYSAGLESMRVGRYYLNKVEKKYLPLLIDTIKEQNNYAKQLFELKNVLSSL